MMKGCRELSEETTVLQMEKDTEGNSDGTLGNYYYTKYIYHFVWIY